MFSVNKNSKLWLLWSMAAVCLCSGLSYIMLSEAADKTVFMPGALSAGHHQLADKCSACHGDAFGGGEVLQAACIECHGKQRVKPFDSHPVQKFKDPRNADLLQKINALACVSCHTEHKPEITARDGVTQPRDLCVHCHQDVAEERESHQGMAFDSCTNAGCHNFHDNRALYTNFLLKHQHQPPLLANGRVPQKEFASMLDELADYPHAEYPVKALGEAEIDAPQRLQDKTGIKHEWLETAHARSGVNCTACHAAVNSNAEQGKEPVWNDHPDHSACVGCHGVEVERFMRGKHGMRLQQGLSAMTPISARLPMKADNLQQPLTCNSCHGAHRFETRSAAVDACLSCHDDEHSLAYEASPHAALWRQEIAGEAEAGSGVSCATCHLPRVSHDISEWSSRIIVDHNQSANLSPNSKMIRTVCLNCHGLTFTLDALADRALIRTNYTGQPGRHITSMDMAKKYAERNRKKTESGTTE